MALSVAGWQVFRHVAGREPAKAARVSARQVLSQRFQPRDQAPSDPLRFHSIANGRPPNTSFGSSFGKSLPLSCDRQALAQGGSNPSQGSLGARRWSPPNLLTPRPVALCGSLCGAVVLVISPGIPSNSGFVQYVVGKHRFLVNTVFFAKRDYDWNRLGGSGWQAGAVGAKYPSKIPTGHAVAHRQIGMKSAVSADTPTPEWQRCAASGHAFLGALLDSAIGSQALSNQVLHMSYPANPGKTGGIHCGTTVDDPTLDCK